MKMYLIQVLQAGEWQPYQLFKTYEQASAVYGLLRGCYRIVTVCH